MLSTLRERLSGDDTDIQSVDALATLTQDDIHDVLSNSRRRHIINYLTQPTDGTATIGELTAYIACEEHDCTPEDLTSQQRKAVYVGLYQCHLPTLDQLDIVDFARNDVHPTPRTQALEDIRTATRTRIPTGGESA